MNITGTEKEWIKDVIGFLRHDAQPNIISALVAGKQMKQFEERSGNQLIDDCMWLLEKFLGKSLPRPINMQRSHWFWLINKNFLGSYSFPSMDTQAHKVVLGKDLAESIYSNDKKHIRVTFMEQWHRVGELLVNLLITTEQRNSKIIVMPKVKINYLRKIRNFHFETPE